MHIGHGSGLSAYRPRRTEAPISMIADATREYCAI
jgi:hypothetical protein